MSIIQLLFSANGRIRRRDWWLACIGFGIFNMVVEFAAHQLLSGNPPDMFFTDLAGWMKPDPKPFSIFLWAYFTIVIWPSICITAKRWHDRNRPGWLAGAVMVLSYALAFAQVYYGPQTPGSIEGVNWPVYGVTALASFGLAIWQFIELGCLDGTKGPNRYGPSPKGADAATDVF
jgi:uncharacterized membrane protein YhaH (DUF805 family)